MLNLLTRKTATYSTGRILLTGLIMLSFVTPITAEEKPKKPKWSFDQTLSEENEAKGIIQLNKDDPTYNIWKKELDTKTGRTPGPFHVNRQAWGGPFLGIPTFLRRPVALNPDDLRAGNVDVAFLGMPIDFNSVRRGTMLGPQAIRTAEVLLVWKADGTEAIQHTDTMIDPLHILNVVDYGDTSPEPLNLERSIYAAIPTVRGAAETGVTLLIAGGSHSVPYPAIRGIVEANRKTNPEFSLGVIHFDAHQDAAPYGFGHPAHYGTFIRSIVNEWLVEGKNVVQVGMRGPINATSGLQFQRKVGIKTYYMADIRNRGWKAVAADILAEFDRDKAPDKLYISVDLDFYDASVAIGTTAPEHGGIMPVDFFPLLRALAAKYDIAALDLVEVAPMLDNATKSTMLLASRTMYELMVGLAIKKLNTDPKFKDPNYKGGIYKDLVGVHQPPDYVHPEVLKRAKN